MFECEDRLSDHFFQVRFAGDNTDYLVRLHPFAVFALDGAVSASDLAELEAPSTACDPLTYVQPLLILTNKCNLRCTYCYAYEGSYGQSSSTMSAEVVGRAIEYLGRVMREHSACRIATGTVGELGLICFGGEPLIALPRIRLAYELLSRLCARLELEGLGRFRPLLTVNTNGVQLGSDALAFLSSIRDSLELVVSFDGWLHDAARVDKRGFGTASRVRDNLFRLRDAGIDVAVTSCLLPEAVEKPERTLESLAFIYRNGIPLNPSFIRGPLEPVRGRAVYPGAVQEKYDPQSLDQFGVLVANEISSDAPIYSRRYRRRLLEGGYRYRCGAALFEIALLPDGTVFPCHNFIADGFALGNILEPDFDVSADHPLTARLLAREVSRLEPCRGCVFQSTCMSSFDCPAHSLQDLGALDRVDERFCGFARRVQGAILQQFVHDCHHG